MQPCDSVYVITFPTTEPEDGQDGPRSRMRLFEAINLAAGMIARTDNSGMIRDMDDNPLLLWKGVDVLGDTRCVRIIAWILTRAGILLPKERHPRHRT